MVKLKLSEWFVWDRTLPGAPTDGEILKGIQALESELAASLALGDVLTFIGDIAYDYDGQTNVDGLKALIDEIYKAARCPDKTAAMLRMNTFKKEGCIDGQSDN
jgi:hypothetical protein